MINLGEKIIFICFFMLLCSCSLQSHGITNDTTNDITNDLIDITNDISSADNELIDTISDTQDNDYDIESDFENDIANKCVDHDGDNYGIGPDCIINDCDDSSEKCTTDCLIDVNHNNHRDCDEDCIDNDKDGYGDGADCLGIDCNDNYYECILDCTDLDNDQIPDCTDDCIDVDDDGSCSFADCDDNNYIRFPGNIEVCDNVDNDCDSSADDGIECYYLKTDTGTDRRYFTPIITDVCTQAFYSQYGYRYLDWFELLIVVSSCDGISLQSNVDLSNSGTNGSLYIDFNLTPPESCSYNTFYSDDSSECTYNSTNGTVACRWGWTTGGDGVVIGSLSGSFCISLSFSNITGLFGLLLYDFITNNYIQYAFQNLSVCRTINPAL